MRAILRKPCERSRQPGRARVLRVLRAARASGALGPREDRAAAFHLVRSLLTPSMAAGWDGTLGPPPGILRPGAPGARHPDRDAAVPGEVSAGEQGVAEFGA
ncbi:hypothetical protein [Streptomyces sp. RKCA744]|uniref:hypothetical protein n=1 Tax=Streptomyces sp. RKCA744 TaxID=2959340 RepID=UPI0020A0F03C|nr:hypothetical protein [Streptomyces sp. RKCA744]MCO8307900.1 hypothetical protein [Streptomyces sp. RKCA744]